MQTGAPCSIICISGQQKRRRCTVSRSVHCYLDVWKLSTALSCIERVLDQFSDCGVQAFARLEASNLGYLDNKMQQRESLHLVFLLPKQPEENTVGKFFIRNNRVAKEGSRCRTLRCSYFLQKIRLDFSVAWLHLSFPSFQNFHEFNKLIIHTARQRQDAIAFYWWMSFSEM